MPTPAETIASLKADTIRECGTYSRGGLVRRALTRRPFRAIVTLRLCQYFRHGGVGGKPMLLLAKLLHRIAVRRAGMEIPWEIEVGPGLAINHGWGIVISPGTRLGKNVTIFHGVTLGRSDRIASDGSRVTGHPTVEDEVNIGPHSIIVGGITIGQGSRIAGGAFVTHHVPPHALMVGNPAEILREDCIPDVMNPA